MISNGLNANCTLITYHHVEVSMDTSVNTQQEIMNHIQSSKFRIFIRESAEYITWQEKTRLPNHKWQKAELSKS